MAPSKDSSVKGYVVEKVAEDKPADKHGVKQGWKVAAVGGKDCENIDSIEIQGLLKACDLPVIVKFEKPPQIRESDSEDSPNELLDDRADARTANAANIGKMDDLPVSRTPENLPEPISGWQDAVDKKILSLPVVQKLQGAGLKRPTIIQRHCIPIIKNEPEHYDMIAQAQTGSGKTFAFVIPMIARLVMKGASPRPFFPGASAQVSPVVMVLSPTRELALQTSQEISVLTKGTDLSQMAIYGGESVGITTAKMEKANIDIVCATPGRLVTLIDGSKMSLAFIECVVLDEADQMLENRLEIICKNVLCERDMPAPGSGRQTLMFSATMPQKIKEMCPELLRENRMAHLMVGNYGDDKGGSCESIQQIIRQVGDDTHRINTLIEDLHTYWIRPGKKGRVVIFSNMRVTADKLAGNLQRAGMSCQHLHGKLDQDVRDAVFDKFRRGQFDVLVATNVASRGLDFPDISLVVQFDIPKDIEPYTHRIGRTGRAGQVGMALSYVTTKDWKMYPKLVEFLELNKQEVPSFLLPRKKYDSGRRSRSRGGGRGGGGNDRGGSNRGYRDDRGGDRGRDDRGGDRGNRGR